MKAILAFVALAAFACGSLSAAHTRRPNILFVLVDDQSPFDLKIYDPQSPLNTPTLDRLAREGMVFDGAYHMGSFSGAVCTPSRHMIMSGRTVWHLPIAPGAMQRGKCPPNVEQQTLPAVFNRAGYATMRTCKIGNSYEAANKLFEVRRDATKRDGDDESGSAWHAEQVLDYLKEREANQDTRPFFIFFGFSHPHDTRDGKPELLAKYGAVNHADPATIPPRHPRQPQLPPNYLPAHPFRHGHDDVRDEVAVSGVWKNRDEATIRNELGREFACVENIDSQLGRVLDRLRAMGELENTWIFYTADNGIAIGRHGLMGKQNLYEHSWRVPFIAKGPGVKAGRRVQGNIYLGDVLATFCDLAGIPVPQTSEGVSFKPLLEGKQTVVRDTLYGVYNGGTKPGVRSIRRGDWKLIQYDVHNGQVRETQLFNLRENPNEFVAEHHNPKVVALTGVQPAQHQRNLAGDPRYADKLKEMQALLLAEMRRLDDPWRLWNQPDDGPVAPPGPAKGPLRVHPTNPRYFTDDGRRAVYLTGAHTWDNLQDMGESDPPAPFDFDAYLEFLQQHRHNFIRLWRWELLRWDTAANQETPPKHLVTAPHPWARTGPGRALDGKPKFNLDRFDETYFQRLRARVQAAQQQGIYVSVMLFEGWGLQHVAGAWAAHPFHPSNHVNGLQAELHGDGPGLEVHTLQVPAVTRVQEAYVRQVVDTLNDLDNVLYEIANEAGTYSTAWQEHFIRFIHDYEKTKPKQHPVGMTFQYARAPNQRGSNAALFNSPADWVSPNPDAGRFNYRTNPPPADGRKVVLSDTDHLWGIGGEVAWVWKSFTRGHNPLFMDPYKQGVLSGGKPDRWEPVRRALGMTRRLADRLDLAAMLPQPELASSGYCLAQAGRAYVVYVPAGGDVTVDLTASQGQFAAEWFKPAQDTGAAAGRVEGGGQRRFQPPFDGEAVLYLDGRRHHSK